MFESYLLAKSTGLFVKGLNDRLVILQLLCHVLENGLKKKYTIKYTIVVYFLMIGSQRFRCSSKL